MFAIDRSIHGYLSIVFTLTLKHDLPPQCVRSIDRYIDIYRSGSLKHQKNISHLNVFNRSIDTWICSDRVNPNTYLSIDVCQKINISHAHAHNSRTHDSRTNHSYEHRASNGTTTLNSRSRRRRPQDRRCPWCISIVCGCIHTGLRIALPSKTVKSRSVFSWTQPHAECSSTTASVARIYVDV